MHQDHDHDTARHALAANPAFARLSPRQLDDIAALADLRTYQPGDVVCREHDAGLEAFVVATGEAAVRVDGIRVATVAPGDLVGDWAMFGDGHRSATVTAVTPLTLVALDPRDLDALLSAVPSASSSVGPR